MEIATWTMAITVSVGNTSKLDLNANSIWNGMNGLSPNELESKHGRFSIKWRRRVTILEIIEWNWISLITFDILMPVTASFWLVWGIPNANSGKHWSLLEYLSALISIQSPLNTHQHFDLMTNSALVWYSSVGLRAMICTFGGGLLFEERKGGREEEKMKANERKRKRKQFIEDHRAFQENEFPTAPTIQRNDCECDQLEWVDDGKTIYAFIFVIDGRLRKRWA